MTIKEENWRDKLNQRNQLENRLHKEMKIHGNFVEEIDNVS